MSYVLFVMIAAYNVRLSGSFQYEFKDQAQCEATLNNMKKKFDTVQGYCQEVRK